MTDHLLFVLIDFVRLYKLYIRCHQTEKKQSIKSNDIIKYICAQAFTNIYQRHDNFISMSNSTYVSNLLAAMQAFSSYSTYITFGLGLIGSLLNIVVFTKLKIFRGNRCTFYLIVESIVDIVQLCQMFVNEIWKFSINGIEPVTVSLVWCKLRTIFPQWLRLMLSVVVCSAAVDQFLSTNHIAYFRQLSSLKLARYQICFATCLCLLHTVPFGIFLEIRPLLGCIITNIGLINYSSFFFYPFLNGLFPIFMSSLFSILAYRNVRRIVRRQIRIDRRRLDQQMTAMIFIRVIFYVLLQLPFTMYRIYSLNLTVVKTDTVEYAIRQWLQAISLALVYFQSCGNLLHLIF